MSLNPHFNNYTASNEQDLTDSLIIEVIQIKGLEMKYMQRVDDNFDALFGEDATSYFTDAKDIEMYLVEVDGFGGDGELMSKFGLDINESATFGVNKTRFKQEFPDLIRPKEGDLLFMPITNSILEIKYVNHDSAFFQQGKQYVYELKCELFNLSHENIETGDAELDALIGSVIEDAPADNVYYGDNDEIENDSDSKITFDANNPFGV